MDFKKQYVLLLSVVVLFVKAAVVSAGLVASYGFNEGSGSTASDTSGNSHTSTLNNSPAWTPAGKYGQCLTFNGISNYVNTHLQLSLGAFTFSCWFKTTADYSDPGPCAECVGPTGVMVGAETLSSSLYIYEIGMGNGIHHGYGGPNYPWSFVWNSDAPGDYTTDGTNVTATSKAVNDGAWHYLAGGRDSNGRAFISLDGGAIIVTGGNAMNLTISAGSDIFIGARSFNNGFDSNYYTGQSSINSYPFTGQIDEVRIYDRALTIDEIQHDMITPIQVIDDPTPPSAPPAVRDGLSGDVGSTTLSTQLSANWDAATDNESGISKYQYAIGTIPGGTNVAGWTDNATTNVTRGGLTLQVGTTYYFSVRAVNGASTPLTGSATNSNGQYVVVGQSGGVLRVSANGRYFTDNSGKAIYLTGSHTWSNFQNWGTGYPVVDFNAYLNFLESKNHNVIRLWVTDTSWREDSGAGACEPQPFVRTGTVDALRGGKKFDLTSFNQVYFDKLSQSVSAAQARGIYVIVMLFDVWGPGGYGLQYGGWPGCPYNIGNNVNSINGSSGQGLFTINSTVNAVQAAYVSKVIDTVNGFDNVLYEIINEGDSLTQAWQSYFINYIRSYEASKPKQHPVGMNIFCTTDAPAQSILFSSNADFISPLGLGPGALYYANPPAADGTKVIITDTDHIEYLRDSNDALVARIWVWKSFLRGLNPILMDTIHEVVGGSANDLAGYENARLAMGYTLAYATKMDMINMAPSSNPSDCSTTYCLRKPGSEYLVYQPGSGGFTLNLNGISGIFTVEWFNPSNGATSQGANVTGGSTLSLTPPFSGEAVAYLKTQSQIIDTTRPSDVATVRDGAGGNVGSTASTTQLSANWDAATDAQSGISGYNYAIGTTPGGTNLASWTTVGNVTTVTKTGLTLAVGTTYYFSVKAINGAASPLDSLNATNSNGQYVKLQDLNSPVAHLKFDEGTGITATDSSDNGNDGTLVSGAGWASGKMAGAVNLDGTDDYVNYGSDAILDFVSGSSFTIAGWVKTSEASGIILSQRNSTDAGAIIDIAVGFDGAVTDGRKLMALVRQNSGTNGQARVTGGLINNGLWHHFALKRNTAGLIELFLDGVSQGTNSGAESAGAITTNLRSIGSEREWVAGSFGTADQRYLAGAIDDVRIYKRALTNQEILDLFNGPNDTTPPSNVANVRDGTSATTDSSCSDSLTALSANWAAATDNESGISGYKYAIGTSAGATDVASWTTIGNVTTIIRTGLNLLAGTTYYFSVKAINGASTPLDSLNATNSNGQYATEGTPVPENLTAYWMFDEGTGTSITDYSGNGNTGTLSNNPVWTTGRVSSGISLDGIDDIMTCNYTPVQNNFTMCAWVKATVTHDVDNQSNSGWAGVSGQKHYLFWPINNGTNAGTGVSVGTNGISVYEHGASYMPALAVYSGTLGTGWNHIAVVYENKQPKIYLNGELKITGLASPRPEVYVSTTIGGGIYGHFKGEVDEVQIYSVSLSSQAVKDLYDSYPPEDTTPPIPPDVVRDGTGADISSTLATTQLSANWEPGADGEIGISGYRYAIGTSQGGTQTLDWTTIADVTAVTKTGLPLIVGSTYYFSVKAVNGVGLQSTAVNSNGQVVLSTSVPDTTPPVGPATVFDGASTGVDATYTNLTEVLSANWTAASDPESSIANYQYAIGTTAGSTNILGWTNIGNVTAITRTGLSLAIASTYYFSVRAINGQGLTGTPANSNGQFVVAVDTADTTPPINIAAVSDGTGGDVGSTTLSTTLSANWDASTDAQSDIKKYWYAIGTTPGASNITDWTDNGPFIFVTKTGLTLVKGTTYYFSVKAENNVGLQSSTTTSNGQYVVPDPNEELVVSAVQVTNITANSVTITWQTNLSGTSQVEYGFTAGYGSSTIDNPSLVTSHGVNITGLTANKTYHYRVKSRTATSTATSPDSTFTTPPTQVPSPSKAHPNPADLRNPGAKVTFEVNNAGGEAKIYTLTGKLIRKLSVGSGAGDIQWDGKNESGQKVARGIYIYKIKTTSGNTTGKLAITH